MSKPKIIIQKLLKDNTPLDGINFQGMVNAEEILEDIDGKMAQLSANIKKYQDLGLEVGCPTMKIFSKGNVDQQTLDNLWYRMTKTLRDSGVRRIGCFTDDTCAHPLVLKPDTNNDTDIRNNTYAAIAKAYQEYYSYHINLN